MLFTKVALLGSLLYDNLHNTAKDIHHTTCFASFSWSSRELITRDAHGNALLHAMACSSIAITASTIAAVGVVKTFYKPRYWPRLQVVHTAPARSVYRASIPAIKPPTCGVYITSLLRTTSPAQRIPAPPQPVSVNTHVHPTFEWVPKMPPSPPSPPPSSAPRRVLEPLPIFVGVFSLIVSIILVLGSVAYFMENANDGYYVELARVGTSILLLYATSASYSHVTGYRLSCRSHLFC